MTTPRHDDLPTPAPTTAPVPRRGQAAYAVVLAVGAFFLMLFVWPLVAAALFFRGVDEGRGLDVPAAQALLAARPADFAAVQALATDTAAGARRDEGDEELRAQLAQQLQALDVRTEAVDGQATAVVVFARFGLPEIYELRLHWLPPALDAAARAGRRLGEHQDALGDGWWRVVR